MTFRFLSPALSELADAAQYYEEQVPSLGADFIDESDAAIERILNYPEAWSEISPGYRRCNLKRFPYTIIYSIQSEEQVLIISVFHQSRSPLSWRRNI